MAFENYPEAEQTSSQQKTVVTNKTNNLPTIITAVLVMVIHIVE